MADYEWYKVLRLMPLSFWTSLHSDFNNSLLFYEKLTELKNILDKEVGEEEKNKVLEGSWKLALKFYIMLDVLLNVSIICISNVVGRFVLIVMMII
jgi:hypothetical protein